MLQELQMAVTASLDITKKLRLVSERVKDADVKMLIADLSIELANVKQNLSELILENTELRDRLRAAELLEADPCPKCRKRTWELATSRPDPVFGEAGGIQRTYVCSSCAFTEQKLLT